MQKSTKSWRLIGSNLLTQQFEETDESCASLVYRCLQAGGLDSMLKDSLCCQTSLAVDPEVLLRHIAAAKEWELSKYTDTKDWRVDGEIPLEEIKEAYEGQGLSGNASGDFCGIKPASTFCVLY